MAEQQTGVQGEWGKTLQLPKTDFAMRANLPQREPAWVQRWLEEGVYEKLRAKRVAAGAGKYIVHLGPPYANGNFHMGHVLTYVLKDFVVRHKFMAGLDSPYAPGWDCHGLPIEWKIELELKKEGKSKYDVSKAELRQRCRDYAAKWIGVQKGEWQRLGALGDWDKPYMTMAPQNEAGTVAELGKMVQRGLVFKALRSTQWSWAEETAMAEAEVEYKEVVSTQVYVACKVVRNQEPGSQEEYLVVWTTTPWTLPANRAVAVKGDERYVGIEYDGKWYWVAEALAEGFVRDVLAGGDVSMGEGVLGREMVGWAYEHPLYGADYVGKVVEGFHVTTDSGTGLVHIAPAHGAEDFVIGKQVGLDLRCPVNGAGKYEDWVAPLQNGTAVAGKFIFSFQKEIVADLKERGLLLAAKDFPHSYPVSWRSKEKLIFRTTEQWFVAMDKPLAALGGKTLREASLQRIYGRDGVRGVEWVPGYGANRIGSMIEGRPDWCISRQRAWGVPITIVVDKASGEPVADAAVWDHVVALIAKEGIDAWDGRILAGRQAELFPAGWLAKHGKTVSDFEYVQDILDVWFDSGTSHAHVLRAESAAGQRVHRTDGKRPADLYQEGSDQHRGWFHSSLLTSVANYGDAPYESVVTSGFVVDGEGRKFSKSLGNGVEPHELLQKYGMDIIRLWVGSSDYSEDIRYSPAAFESMADAYRRFRNTFRWLLGNLNGFLDDAATLENLPELERYMLHRLGKVLAEVRGHYEAFQFHKGQRALYEFCGTELSNFYFDVRKDILYCDKVDSPERVACLSVLVQIFKGLVTHLAPLMPFTTDEAWRERYGVCVHLGEYFVPDDRMTGRPDDGVTGLAEEGRWEALFKIRSAANFVIEKKRVAGEGGANIDYKIEVLVGKDVSKFITSDDTEMVRLVCGVSGTQLKLNGDEGIIGVTAYKYEGHKCPRCWRYYEKLEAKNGLCLRCEEAVA